MFPCTFDPRDWSEDESIKNLFAGCCSGETFAYDSDAILLRRHRESKILHQNNLDARGVERFMGSQVRRDLELVERASLSPNGSGSQEGYSQSISPSRRAKKRRLVDPKDVFSSDTTITRTSITDGDGDPETISDPSKGQKITRTEDKDSKPFDHAAIVEQATTTRDSEQDSEYSKGDDSVGSAHRHLKEPAADDDSLVPIIDHEGSQVTLSDREFESQSANAPESPDLMAVPRRKQSYVAAQSYLRSDVPLEHSFTLPNSDNRDEEIEL